MLSRWPIRYKLVFGVAMLCLIVATLSFTGFRGVYAFRKLTKSIKARANELPLAAALTNAVSDLRVTLRSNPTGQSAVDRGFDTLELREEFRTYFYAVDEALRRYKEQLQTASDDDLIADTRREQEAVREIEQALQRIKAIYQNGDWVLDYPRLRDDLDRELEGLQQLSARLPGFMKQRMDDFALQARAQYRGWIAATVIATGLAGVMMLVLVRQFYTWVFRPLRLLIRGSRRVAAGNFSHRIQLNTHDEVSELAASMNEMTSRFQEVRDELDDQVKQRTKEVVRSEQLASVGFLAAGVAHEINNPLASIAWAAEALESRLHDIIVQDDSLPDDEHNEEITVLRKYLRRIQDEAFRCKGITDNLLDYSRMGDVEKQNTQLAELVEGVIDMVRHLGKYREKGIAFHCEEPVIAPVNPQEIKQVVLNLITNGLDSLDPAGTVTVNLRRAGSVAELVVSDNGCGMSEEVLKHLFEPFFTRRRDGQGTGLGLSITYRIVSEHGGHIDATSEGPGHGSRFRVTLPLVQHEEENERRFQAA